jgi:replication fork clamp-binding protein CrfC
VPASDVEYVVEGYERLQMDTTCHSLLKKHLTREVLDQLKDICTVSFRSSLRDVIQVYEETLRQSHEMLDLCLFINK